MSTPTALYRLFGDGDELLYIGISDTFGRRWNQHAQSKPWWPEVKRQTVDWHPSREDADAAEKAAIKAEHPKYNIAHQVPRPKPLPKAKPRGPRLERPPFFWIRLTPEKFEQMLPTAILGGFDLGGWQGRAPGAETEEWLSFAWDFREAFLRAYGNAIRSLHQQIVLTRAIEEEHADSPSLVARSRSVRGSLYKLAKVPCPECAGSPPGRMTCTECGVTGQDGNPGRSLGSELALRAMLPALKQGAA